MLTPHRAADIGRWVNLQADFPHTKPVSPPHSYSKGGAGSDRKSLCIGLRANSDGGPSAQARTGMRRPCWVFSDGEMDCVGLIPCALMMDDWNPTASLSAKVHDADGAERLVSGTSWFICVTALLSQWKSVLVRRLEILASICRQGKTGTDRSAGDSA